MQKHGMEGGKGPAKRLLSVKEATFLYGIGRSKFYQEVAAGRIRLRKLGRRALVGSDDMEDWAAGLSTVNRKRGRRKKMAPRKTPRAAVAETASDPQMLPGHKLTCSVDDASTNGSGVIPIHAVKNGAAGHRRWRAVNRPKGAFVWFTREFLASQAWREMPLAARRVVERVAIEHMNHGGTLNGSLIVTYNDFEKFDPTEIDRAGHQGGGRRLGFWT